MWRSRIFWRLFGAYSILLAVSLGLLGWLLIRRMESHLLEEIRQSLEQKSLLISELAARCTKEQLQPQMTRLGQQIQARITLMAADGVVLADSMEQPENMENHLDRSEVRRSEVEGIGVATRHSGTVHQPMMYLARRADAGPVRFVRVALPLTAVNAEVGWLRWMVWTGTFLTLLIA